MEHTTKTHSLHTRGPTQNGTITIRWRTTHNLGNNKSGERTAGPQRADNMRGDMLQSMHGANGAQPGIGEMRSEASSTPTDGEQGYLTHACTRGTGIMICARRRLCHEGGITREWSSPKQQHRKGAHANHTTRLGPGRGRRCYRQRQHHFTTYEYRWGERLGRHRDAPRTL